MASRPSMHARDSSGNKVSLLNDDPTPHATNTIALGFRNPNYGNPAAMYPNMMQRSYSGRSAQSIHSSPRTPSLHRSDSYDSNTGEPISPATPLGMGEFGRPPSFSSAGYESKYDPRASYDYSMQQYHVVPNVRMPSLRPELPRRQSSYSDHHSYDDEHANGGNSDSRTKRYACRFRESHNCEKTFTTSGHASRHSKIHTAEKAVNCTFQGCHKKFTRADNMKQHLETHNKNSKDRSTSTNGSRLQNSNTPKALTRPAGISKSAPRPSSSNSCRSDDPPHSQSQYGVVDRYSMHVPHSPVHQYHPHSQPMIARTESSSGGLDALAAVACSSVDYPSPRSTL